MFGSGCVQINLRPGCSNTRPSEGGSARMYYIPGVHLSLRAMAVQRLPIMEGQNWRESGREQESSSVASTILRLVSDVSSSVEKAKNVDDVICALHSLAVRIFPVDSVILSGCLDYSYKNQMLHVDIQGDACKETYSRYFYERSSFPAFARILLYDVALNWLSCFPLTARSLVFDSFFVNAPMTETLQVLIPVLAYNPHGIDDTTNAVCSNAERLLVHCLFECEGVCRMADEFNNSLLATDCTSGVPKKHNSSFQSKMAQLVASIPDKARIGALQALSARQFFKQVALQLLHLIEYKASMFFLEDNFPASVGALSFIGQLMARICRRGSADILVHEMLPCMLKDVRLCLSDSRHSSHLIGSNSKSHIWQLVSSAIKDSYAVERFSEALLFQMTEKHVNDEEAHGILQMLFSEVLTHDRATRNLFTEKFLLRKVFPIWCLRWLLQFVVFNCPPSATKNGISATQCSLEIFRSLVNLWSKKEFVQSAPMDQQTYISAAVGLSLEKLSRENLEANDVCHLLLQGVSIRLENPDHLIRRMASSVALAFSKVVDPQNPLFLDDSCREENIDWEFGLSSRSKRHSNAQEKDADDLSRRMLDMEFNGGYDNNGHNLKKDVTVETSTGASNKGPDKNESHSHHRIQPSGLSLVDPDEIVDPAVLSHEHRFAEEDDDDSVDSGDSSDSSLQPYDMSDDNTDLRRNFSQLVDIVSALRKSDDPDGVERALDVAETLIKAAPDELHHVTSDLVKALVHVRCSDIALEEDEESTEKKRQKALVALIYSCPFESLDVLTKLLYSPNVDLSQRILILDVLTDGAMELSDAKNTTTVKHGSGAHFSIIDIGNQPWNVPRSKGPSGAGPWKEVSESGTLLNWSQRYERKLPSKEKRLNIGKTRRWANQLSRIQENPEWTKNRFPVYAAAFMLPLMQGYDRKSHGVDLLGRDFIVLGKLIHLLGVCMKCMTLHPEASALAPPVLNLISSRMVSSHCEAYVRRSVLFTVSCILLALHPSAIASALSQGNDDISRGLEWARTWALHVAEKDTDTECSSMAMVCLQLHSEMALQVSRVVESTDHLQGNSVNLLKGPIRFK